MAEKISYLEEYLDRDIESYADTFKGDILNYLGNFEIENPNFKFLSNLSSKAEIQAWVSKLSSRIILKHDEEFEQLSDFIFDYIENG
ncbi:MAG: hypothetical protein JJT94_14885 [Bernardetiaceae bacterium]|nr:hypothetical protein [Bernardetiaceae bacterium]